MDFCKFFSSIELSVVQLTSISRAFSVPVVTVATVVIDAGAVPVGVLGVSGFKVFL